MIATALADVLGSDVAGGPIGWLVSGGLGGAWLYLWKEMRSQTDRVRAFHAEQTAAAERRAEITEKNLERHKVEAGRERAEHTKEMDERLARWREMWEAEMAVVQERLADCEKREQRAVERAAQLTQQIADIKER